MSVKRIAGTGIFCALACALTIASNYIVIASININLSIICIAAGALLFGPISGGVIGLVNGAVTLLAPTTIALFLPTSPIGTIIICLSKGTIAGIVAGVIYQLLKNKNQNLSIILTLLIVPIINTGIFVLLALIFYEEIFALIFTIFLLVNFGIEFVISLLVSVIIIKNKKTFKIL